MRVALFIDGKNFYSGWRDLGRGARVDFERMADWLVEQAGGSVLWGAYYYTGVEGGEQANSDPQRQLARFLEEREHDRGFFVKRFARRAHATTCSSCGALNRFTQEKEVDTTMVADMLSLAAVGAFDVAVLISGDADHAPAVEGVRGLGKKVVVATWGHYGLSARIRKAAFSHIDLLTGVELFTAAPAKRGPAAEPPVAVASTPGVSSEHVASDAARHPEAPTAPPEASSAEVDDAFLAELDAASERLTYVGVNYFVTRWRSDRLTASPDVRRRVLNRLVTAGAVEVYDAPGGSKALRRRG